MKKIYYLFSSLTVAALLFTTGCKDKEDTVDPAPEAKVVTLTMTDNNPEPMASLDVTTSDGTAKLKLDVTSTTDLDQIFVMKSEDNDDLTPVTTASITKDGKTFTGGSSSYTLKVPASTKNFVIEIPVSVRSTSAAVTDVYYVWITNGSGDFTKPTKNRVLGPAIATLKYNSSASTVSYSSATLDIGTQSAVKNSFLVTSGQVSALSTTDYNDAPGSADIRLVSLDGSGKKNNTATNVYLYSPADITDANPPSDASTAFSAATGSNTTYFVAYTTKTFENVTGTDLQAITFGTAKSIQITSGSTYAFKTAEGKIGVLKVNSLTADTDATNAGGYNANVSIKVLN